MKRRYQGVCRGCGAPTAARGGKGDAYQYCKRCHPGAIAPTRTREWVRDAMREWRALIRQSAVVDGLVSHPRAHGVVARRSNACATGIGRHPSTVIDLYGTWAAARSDAFPDD